MNFTVDPVLGASQQGHGFVTTLIFPFFTNVTTAVTNSLGAFLFYGTVAPATGSIGVADYNNHIFQASMTGTTGTGSFTVKSTVDRVNFVTEFTTGNLMNTSSYTTLSGRRLYFLATYSGSGNVTGSLYLISGQ